MVAETHVLNVQSFGGDYAVMIGSNLLREAGRRLLPVIESTAPLLVVFDERLAEYGYPEMIIDSLRQVYSQVSSVAVPSGEQSKSLAESLRLYSACVQAGLDRNAAIIALGGGVVGDLAGFVAATYMRGVRFVQVPTTLLAHDASIGGKVAIDITEGKNLVGAFHPPKLVLYDVATLHSLPMEQRSSGLAEAVKHGVIRDTPLFAWIASHTEDLLAAKPDALTELLYRSCKVKADVVSIDEREMGLRAILNFGHTIGHAVETLAAGTMSHGAAVAIGMVLETRLAKLLGLTSGDVEQRLVEVLTALRLPTALPDEMKGPEAGARLVELMRHDKKAVRRSLSFVLPIRLGEVTIDKSVAEERVVDVLEARSTHHPG